MLTRLFRRPGPRPPLAAAARAPGDDAEDPARGCGWFDSSHDLTRGLCVHELSNPDALAQALPLAAWLELQLGGRGVTHPA